VSLKFRSGAGTSSWVLVDSEDGMAVKAGSICMSFEEGAEAKNDCPSTSDWSTEEFGDWAVKE
jgi:hypothetical protein